MRNMYIYLTLCAVFFCGCVVNGAEKKPQFADNELLDFDDVLFIKRSYLPPSETQGNHMCDQYFGFHAIPGGGLFILKHAFSDKQECVNILENSICTNGRFKGEKLPEGGGFLSPDLSYDGKQILFAFTEGKKDRYKWTEETVFHIFKVNIDGTRLTQLTDGTTNDFDPCWLPNGRIVFISERRGGYGRCHARPVPNYTLHSMNAEGSDIVCLSPHETNEWHPSVNNNGMIVYTRWDYVDRGYNQAHHPWITFPDGRDPRAIHGNFKEKQADNPCMELNVRSIPGSHKYVAVATPHHGQAYGSMLLIDPRVKDDNKLAPIKRLTLDAKYPEADTAPSMDQKYATPWALSERYYLCVYDPEGSARRGTKNNHAICLFDADTQKKTILYKDPVVGCLDPIPIRVRKTPPQIPHRTAVGKPLAPGEKFNPAVYKNVPNTGTVGVVNVYDSTLPLPEGTKIKYLRIIKVLPKTTPHHLHPQISYGTEKSPRAVLGTVPVEGDGSAFFTLPAGRAVFFQALDEKMEAVQSMRSATYVHPGEQLLCNGCHEPRHKTPSISKVAMAFKRAPSEITPDVSGSNPFSFPLLVQPVLDKKCVQCHLKNADKGAPDLRKGDFEKHEKGWYTSYQNLQKYSYFYGPLKGYDRWQTPTTIPGKFGSKVAKLATMLRKGHHDLKLTEEDKHRIFLWLDCNSDFYGSCQNTKEQAEGKVVMPTLE